jgi:hypothetical protein
MSETTFWNGEPTPAVCGTGIVLPSPEHPLFWGANLVGTRIPVVQVDYYGDRFWLDNRDGSGWAKVTTGHGSPRYGHRDCRVADFVLDGLWDIVGRSS